MQGDVPFFILSSLAVWFMKYDPNNKMFQLAVDLVNQSSRSIFLTGKAGTGKTTFLKYIRETCPKQMAVVAPTGVAAINAGGVTIHSFFQLPFAPFVPETQKFSKDNDKVVSRHGLVSRLRLNTEKIKVLQQLELLVIDEVSMVRCDTMDAIDTVLRHARKRPLERFGGVQVLFIGDMFQLPPVVKEDEWRLLSDHYNSPYFFDSQVIREEQPVYIEFDKIYRQSEEEFIRVLNQVRNNELDEDGRQVLENRYNPSYHREKEDGYIVLTTHNEKAKGINARELNNLPGRQFSYGAVIKDDFPENAYPGDDTLNLKEGAQVMFIKNDSQSGKRYFNGKIGIVTRLEEEKIFVRCKDEAAEIEVNRETWKNIRYTVNKTSRGVDEEELGSFSQYPLRLAWAITIHKSQGLTFTKAIIDAGEAFAAGQVYVALSRCTSLDGMILQSRIRGGSLFTDKRIVEFSRNLRSEDMLEEELSIAKKNYQSKIILSTFDFSMIAGNARELVDYIMKNESSFNEETIPWVQQIAAKLDQSQATALKFQNWLQAQFQQSPELDSPLLLTKIRDGAAHFIKEFQEIVGFLQQSPAVTDSMIHTREFNETVKEIFAALSMKIFLLNEFTGKLDIEDWHKKKKGFVLPPFSVNAYAAASGQKVKTVHPQLYYQLKKLRDSICAKKDLPVYHVAGSKTLDEMVSFLPQTPEELEEISGFGKVRVESYGKQFLEIIVQYCKDYQLSSRMSEKVPKKKRKETKEPKEPKQPKETKPRIDTRAESFRLYKEGLSVPDIAQARNFTVQTIENHLAYYVQRGEIGIEELVSPEKVSLIETAIRDLNGGPIGPVKEKLGDSIGYNEIRLVLAWQTFKKDITPET